MEDKQNHFTGEIVEGRLGESWSLVGCSRHFPNGGRTVTSWEGGGQLCKLGRIVGGVLMKGLGGKLQNYGQGHLVRVG